MSCNTLLIFILPPTFVTAENITPYNKYWVIYFSHSKMIKSSSENKATCIKNFFY